MDFLFFYFPELTVTQKVQFTQLGNLYQEWNEKINVISRKDMEHFYTHHVLHSMAIAKFVSFLPGTTILDVETGGGFPGIPLAILFPECQFLLVDSIGKKITVVEEVVNALGLTNVEAQKTRVEELDVEFDFVVSRAVAPIREIIGWTRKLIEPGGLNSLKNGWLLLKGGDLKQEIGECGLKTTSFDLTHVFSEPFFETKKLLYIPR